MQTDVHDTMKQKKTESYTWGILNFKSLCYFRSCATQAFQIPHGVLHHFIEVFGFFNPRPHQLGTQSWGSSGRASIVTSAATCAAGHVQDDSTFGVNFVPRMPALHHFYCVCCHSHQRLFFWPMIL